ncbi:MAG: VanW family protein [Anaerolineales bacterium]|nr:VanW family protein [Anaerolineales bacterium]
MHTTSTLPAVPTRPRRPLSIGIWLARLGIAAGFVLAMLASAALIAMAVFGLRHRDVIYPGVSAWGLDLSGQTPAAAAAELIVAFDYPAQPVITFRDGERAWTATPAQLGLTVDLARTVNAAYGVGRTGSVLADAWDTFSAWYAGVQVSPVVVYDESQTLLYLNAVAQVVYRPTVEASLTAEATTITTTPGQIGRQLDVLAAAAAVRPVLLGLGSGDIPLVFIETPPLVLDASAQAAAARAIVSAPFSLTLAEPQPGDQGPWAIEPAALGDMLQVRRVEDGPNAAHYEVGLDRAALQAFLQPLAEPLRQTARNARFIFNDDTRQLEMIQPSQAARELDVVASLAAIEAALASGAHSAQLAVTITPPAAPGEATAEALGIRELVSEQSTYFVGSSAERVRNIEVASARFHGLLIPPGETFSFNAHLGDVSLDTGFAEALIIYGGRTIRGVGGGVCQVSTTVFRAAYFGGYPIVERYSHAYRVGYYERGDTWRGPGLDATVYAPLVDFKFQNDSAAWLLMEVYVNPAAGRLTWRFYSTSDGRQVTVGPPDVRNVVPAPEPLYEEDPELAPGQIVQVDYAAEGADVSVARTILRDGVPINANEGSLTTHYQPWRAVFNYGPGTQGIPTPTPTP